MGAKSHEGEQKSAFLANCRYVKILLLNTFDITEEEAQKAPYKVVHNDIYAAKGWVGWKHWYYPKTELVQITVFGK